MCIAYMSRLYVLDHLTCHVGLSQPEYIPLSKLQRYIAPDQIPEELGGTFQYSHEDWIQDRMVRQVGEVMETLASECGSRKLLNN